MTKKIIALVGLLPFLLPVNAIAENYAGLGMGWTFSQKLTSGHGNENLNYPDPSGGTFTNGGSLYPDTHITDVNLKNVLQGGVKAGHYFDSVPSLGVELEVNYSQPNMFRQNVTLSNNSFKQVYDNQNHVYPFPNGNFTEDQQKAKVQILQFNANGLYRYQANEKITPYIGGGPSFNIIRISGTGYSGIIVDPFYQNASCPVGPHGSLCSNVNTTSMNVGLNFKVGAEYKFDDNWGLAAEYHYNWVPVTISSFRSMSDVKADLEMQSISAVVVRHF